MRLRGWRAVFILVLAGLSCSRDPEVVKRKYLQSGNKYFEKGQYKEASIMYRQALRKDQRYGEAYYRLGLTQLKLSRPLEALGSLRRAVELQPNNTDAKVQLAEIYLSALLVTQRTDTRRIDSLRAELKHLADQLLERDPRSVPGLRYTGYLLLSENKVKEAVAKFRQANEISAARPEIVLPLVQSLMADNQAEEAEKLAKDLLAREKTFGPIYDVLYLHYLRTNRTGEAEQILKSKVENNPKQADYLLQLAAFYYAVKREPETRAVLNRLTSNLKDFPSAHELAGDFYRRRGEFEKALTEYDLGIRNDAKQTPLYQKKKAQVLIDQGKRAEASRLLDEVLKEDPKDAQAQAMRASLLIETGSAQELQTAVSELQSMVSRMPDNPVLRFNLGRALLRKREFEQARTQFQEAINKQPGYLPPRIALAELHLARLEFPAALQAVKETLARDPRNLPAKLIQTAALAGMGNLAQARASLMAALKEHPGSREAMMQLGMLDLAEKNYEAAEETFARLQDTAPLGDLRGLMGLTETYAARKQFDKASQLLRKELANNPERSQIRLALANIAVRGGQYDEAIAEYQQLIRKNPKAGDLYLRLGETQRRKGDLPAAIASFRKSAELLPKEPAAHLSLALLLDTLGHKSEAMKTYETILQIQPDHAVALNNLAYMMAETGGDLDEALTLAQRARQKLPNDLNVADTLGWIYIKKNLSDNAIGIFRDLVARQPDNSTFHYHLAMAFYQKGDRLQARKALQTALQKKPSPEEAAKIKDLMAKVG